MKATAHSIVTSCHFNLLGIYLLSHLNYYFIKFYFPGIKIILLKMLTLLCLAHTGLEFYFFNKFVHGISLSVFIFWATP